MIGHYLITALRNSRRFPLATAMNVFALALGLVCFVASFLFIESLGNMDRQFPKASRTYVITQRLWLGEGQKSIPPLPAAAPPTAKYLQADFPELEATARALPIGSVSVSDGEKARSMYAVGVDPAFLRIFDLPFIAGDAVHALDASNAMVITESAAKRLFGAADAVGRRMVLQGNVEMTVAGVISGIAQPSHLGDTQRAMVRFDILVPMKSVRALTGGSFEVFPVNPEAESWGVDVYYTYVLFPEHTALTLRTFDAALKSFGERHVPKRPLRCEFGAIPLAHIALQNLDAFIDGAGVSVTTALFLLDVLVLAVACLNYANLATALGLVQAKEVAMRKIMGASRAQLVWQYTVEAALMASIALVIVFAGLTATLPALRATAVSDLDMDVLSRPGFWGLMLLLIFGVSLAAGAYPALVVSRLRPSLSLQQTRLGLASSVGSTILMSVQFAAASFLLILVLLMHEQSVVLRRSGLHAQDDPVVVITSGTKQAHVSFETLRAELLKIPEIKNVSAGDRVPWQSGGSHVLVSRSPDASAKRVQTLLNHVSYDFFSTLGIRVIAGREFERAHADEIPSARSGESQAAHVIIDRALAADLGWKHPSDAVGQFIFGASSPVMTTPERAEIVGVVENDFPRLMGFGAASNLFHLAPATAGIPVVRIARNRIPQALEQIDAAWSRLAPHTPVRRVFMDELFARAYEIFAGINKVFDALAIVALLISSMSLLGMAAHVLQRRAREIGVRKTLGANAGRIITMLLSGFSRPVVIANLLAWPLAWLAGQIYLDLFAQRASLSFKPFVLSLMLIVVIACIAVAAQAVRAARAKPSQVLRYE